MSKEEEKLKKEAEERAVKREADEKVALAKEEADDERLAEIEKLKSKVVTPFVPLQDEHGNVISKEQPVYKQPPPKTGEFKTYKTIYSGVTPIPVIIENRKRYLQFNKHEYRTNNVDEQSALDEMLAEDSNLPVSKRKILTEDEFTEHFSPEKVFQQINGYNYHISELREMEKFAIEHGYKRTGKLVHILPDTKSKISQGGRSASSGGI